MARPCQEHSGIAAPATVRRLYAEHRVPYYWIVDTDGRTLEALALRDGAWLELGSWGEDDVARIDPFSEVELAIGRLFLPKGTQEPVD